jgi:hypothetical protein
VSSPSKDLKELEVQVSQLENQAMVKKRRLEALEARWDAVQAQTQELARRTRAIVSAVAQPKHRPQPART